MEKKKMPRWAKIVLIVIAAILALLMILAGAAAIYIDALLGKINYRTTHPSLTPEEASSVAQENWETIPSDDTTPMADDVTEPTAPTATDPVEEDPDMSHIVNILLIGQDRRPGEGTQRSDSMILVTFNKSTGNITLTSIMRDQNVHIPGYGSDKLNHAYQYGGMPLLDQTLYDHFGIVVDGNVEVDFSGFQQVIDLLGGVDVTLTEAEAEYLRNGCKMDVQAGLNHLDGAGALNYARLREIDSDYRRASRQRNVLIAIFEKYKSKDLATMLSLMDQILPLLTTDLSKDQIVGLALEVFPMLAGAQIDTLRIPADGTFQSGYVQVSPTYRTWYQYNIDFEANRKLLEEIFAP